MYVSLGHIVTRLSVKFFKSEYHKEVSVQPPCIKHKWHKVFHVAWT